ncbi:MAG TPA: hypothetical protein VFG56_01895 [Candidatus Saccharimonadales bacterium]|nr:hypothetical protein [Candidatus Saccharimonadales bacterium]
MDQIESQEAQRQADFEAFEAERRLTDELTEASEKLAMPMRNRFDYDLRPDGELYFEGQSLDEVFKTGVEVAEHLTKEQPEFYVEMVRRHLEYDEYQWMKRLAAGRDDEPDLLVVVSPIPDAVVSGEVDLNAYDRERKKTLVRVFERTEQGLSATSLSLDLSDRDGLREIAETLGDTISDDDSSEDILAKRLLGERRSFGDRSVARTLRRIYDQVLEDKYGRSFLGGRPDDKSPEALSFIKRQTDLIEQHMAELDRLREIGASDKAIRRARHNFAAALDRRLSGEADAASLADAGDVAEARGQSFEGDCPTGVTATSSANSLGFGNKKQSFMSKSCPICGASNVLTTIEGETISGSCGCQKEICSGKVTRINRPSQAPSNTAGSWSPTVEKPRLPGKNQLIKQQFGEYAVIKTQLTIGGANRLVVDKRTGQLIAKL